jgi:predicted nucleic acid-binding protein
MERVALLDTGPPVSFLADGLVHHPRAVEQWKQLRPPLLTCEPVLTEAAFLLKREGRDIDVLFVLSERGIIRIGLAVEEQHADIRALMRRYRSRPISLADACLVRLSEIHAAAEVLTLDRDFRICRPARQQSHPGPNAGLKRSRPAGVNGLGSPGSTVPMGV